MESLNVDYDLTSIPAGYDLGRDHSPEVLNLWMSVIDAHVDGKAISTILDLGCGTGRFSEGLAIDSVPESWVSTPRRRC
jgi:ubiquinone/menaquinone biosynthesis C-methylase UbiE